MAAIVVASSSDHSPDQSQARSACSGTGADARGVVVCRALRLLRKGTRWNQCRVRLSIQRTAPCSNVFRSASLATKPSSIRRRSSAWSTPVPASSCLQGARAGCRCPFNPQGVCAERVGAKTGSLISSPSSGSRPWLRQTREDRRRCNADRSSRRQPTITRLTRRCLAALNGAPCSHRSYLASSAHFGRLLLRLSHRRPCVLPFPQSARQGL